MIAAPGVAMHDVSICLLNYIPLLRVVVFMELSAIVSISTDHLLR